MPYVIVEGSLDANKEGSKNIFSTSVSGLKAGEISELINLSPGPSRDNYTLDFRQHPCVILNALEVLGFRIVASSSSGKEALTTIWTLRKEFENPEPSASCVPMLKPHRQ